MRITINKKIGLNVAACQFGIHRLGDNRESMEYVVRLTDSQAKRLAKEFGESVLSLVSVYATEPRPGTGFVRCVLAEHITDLPQETIAELCTARLYKGE